MDPRFLDVLHDPADQGPRLAGLGALGLGGAGGLRVVGVSLGLPGGLRDAHAASPIASCSASDAALQWRPYSGAVRNSSVRG